MFIWPVAVILLLWVVMFRFRRRKMYKMAARLPASKRNIPVLGIAHLLGGSSEGIMEELKYHSYQAMEHNGLVTFWNFHQLVFVMVNPEDLEYVLKTCLEKSDLHKFARSIIGNGGIFAPVSIWRRRRKIMVPTFGPKMLETFVKVFSAHSEKLASTLEGHAHGGSVSMWPFLSSYTLHSILETTMGVKSNSQEDPNSTIILVAISKMLDILCQRYFHLWLQPDWLYRVTPQYRQQNYYAQKVYAVIDEVIKKRRNEEHIERANKMEPNIQFDDATEAKTFLSHHINLSESNDETGFTDVELREEVMTLIVAGTDTSAVAAGFSLMLFAKYPQLQEKAYQEIYGVFEKSERPLAKEDLPKLQYLERFVKEILRLFPPVPITVRKVENDVTLPSGYVLPAGGIILTSIWGVHRDPKYWGPAAEEFDPDRFLPERFNEAHACSFMPFSRGPRNCLGYQYALMSIKTVLSAILRRYKILGEVETSPIPNIRVKLDIMMKALDEYTVTLERRRP